MLGIQNYSKTLFRKKPKPANDAEAHLGSITKVHRTGAKSPVKPKKARQMSRKMAKAVALGAAGIE